jgi:hypothetical protein
MTGKLATPSSSSPPTAGDTVNEEDVAWSTDGKQCMWSPSCLVWNYLRVRKTATGASTTTTAYAFGQINS